MRNYSKDLGKKVIEYLTESHSHREAARVFNINLPTVNRWNRKYQKTWNLKDRPAKWGFKKIDSGKLEIYVEQHPDAYRKEIEKAFGYSSTAIPKALKQLAITCKKRRNDSVNKTL